METTVTHEPCGKNPLHEVQITKEKNTGRIISKLIVSPTGAILKIKEYSNGKKWRVVTFFEGAVNFVKRIKVIGTEGAGTYNYSFKDGKNWFSNQ